MAISVLVVEDDKNIRELLQMYLEKEGYAVTLAADGQQGLAKFQSPVQHRSAAAAGKQQANQAQQPTTLHKNTSYFSSRGRTFSISVGSIPYCPISDAHKSPAAPCSHAPQAAD